jgi:hypothetical protein
MAYVKVLSQNSLGVSRGKPRNRSVSTGKERIEIQLLAAVGRSCGATEGLEERNRLKGRGGRETFICT